MSATITATADKTIIDGGEQMPLPKEQLKKVRHLVYYCPDCTEHLRDGPVYRPECKAYHFWDGKTFEDVEAILGISNRSRFVPA